MLVMNLPQMPEQTSSLQLWYHEMVRVKAIEEALEVISEEAIRSHSHY